MRPSERRKWRTDDEPSPREIREMRERGEWVEEEDEEPVRKAPLPFRILAWVSLIAIFFAVGYGATSLAFRWMDSGSGTKTPPNLVGNRQEAENLIARARSEDQLPGGAGTVSCTLSIPEGEGFVTREIRCTAGLREDTMKQALAAYMDALKESRMLEATAASLNVFQSGDALYLNVNKDFHDSLKKIGAEKSRFLLTGLVMTMSNNFTPVNKIRFFVDGKEVTDKNPVDLTAAWGLPGRS